MGAKRDSNSGLCFSFHSPASREWGDNQRGVGDLKSNTESWPKASLLLLFHCCRGSDRVLDAQSFSYQVQLSRVFLKNDPEKEKYPRVRERLQKT